MCPAELFYPLAEPCVHPKRGICLHVGHIGRVNAQGDVHIGVADTLADDLHVNTIHQQMRDVAVPKTMLGDLCHLGGLYELAEGLR